VRQAVGHEAAALALRRPVPAVGALAALVALNAPFYALLLRRRGPAGTAAGVALHALHHLTAVAAVPLGAARFLARPGEPVVLSRPPPTG
jgi:hypothetical protein